MTLNVPYRTVRPACPQCGGQIHRVTRDSDSMLNEDQFDAVRAGDWYCEHCKGTEAKTGYKYWWNRELRGEASLNAPEPEPKPSTGDLWDLVIADINHKIAGEEAVLAAMKRDRRTKRDIDDKEREIATMRATLADMRERSAFGLAKYGKPLQPHDGRRSLVDAYQEALDFAVYIRKEIEERRIEREMLERAMALIEEHTGFHKGQDWYGCDFCGRDSEDQPEHREDCPGAALMREWPG